MARQTLIRWLLVLVLCGKSLPMHAQSEDKSAEALLQQASMLASPLQSWALLQQHVNAHLKQVDYNYALGLYAAQSGQYGQAINALERVVLIRPEFSGAWVDLSLAYAGAGDYATAIELASYVQDKLDPPAHVQTLLAQRLVAWKRLMQQAQRQGQTHQISMEVGYSSNPTAFTLQDAVPLFLGQWVNLPLSAKDRAASSALVGVRFVGVDTWQQQRFYTSLMARNFPDNTPANQWAGSVQWLLPEDQYGYWQFGLERFDIGLSGYQNNVSLARVMALSSEWQLRLGYRFRRGEDKTFDANLPSLTLNYAHQLAPAHVVRSYVSVEQDNPLSDRPGGMGNRLSAGVAWDASFERYGLFVSYMVSNYRDQEEYALLLPVARHLMWRQLRAQLTIPLTRSWSSALLVQHEQQAANHALFTWEDTQIITRVSYAF